MIMARKKRQRLAQRSPRDVMTSAVSMTPKPAEQRVGAHRDMSQ